jgi:hypothetical protein
MHTTGGSAQVDNAMAARDSDSGHSRDCRCPTTASTPASLETQHYHLNQRQGVCRE